MNPSLFFQAERDYLRQKILEIFEEDESALTEQDSNKIENNRKRGYSLPNDGIGKNRALKKYDLFALNTSCFWRNTRSKYYLRCAISRKFLLQK